MCDNTTPKWKVISNDLIEAAVAAHQSKGQSSEADRRVNTKWTSSGSAVRRLHPHSFFYLGFILLYQSGDVGIFCVFVHLKLDVNN